MTVDTSKEAIAIDLDHLVRLHGGNGRDPLAIIHDRYKAVATQLAEAQAELASLKAEKVGDRHGPTVTALVEALREIEHEPTFLGVETNCQRKARVALMEWEG